MKKTSNIVQFKGYKRFIEIDLNKYKYYFFENPKLNPFQEENVLLKKYTYSSPSIITNAILSLSKINGLNNNKKFDDLFTKLELLICKHIVIEIKFENNLDLIQTLIESINNHNIHEFSLFLDYSENLYSDNFADILLNTNRLKNVIIFNSPFNKNLEDIVHFTTKDKKINFNKSINEFYINHELFFESQNKHTYFNRKLFISELGDIKNAPECDEIFGNIKKINSIQDLNKIIFSKEFKKYWDIKKDEIDICKDCEFRNMCVDNRLLYQRNENEWFHKIECNYNPYIAKWLGEKGYKTLEECGVFSNENGFFINHEKICKINEVLWDEKEVEA